MLLFRREDEQKIAGIVLPPDVCSFIFLHHLCYKVSQLRLVLLYTGTSQRLDDRYVNLLVCCIKPSLICVEVFLYGLNVLLLEDSRKFLELLVLCKILSTRTAMRKSCTNQEGR